MSTQTTANINKSNWALRLIIILSLVGLAIAVYLMITYAQGQTPYCAGSDGCATVQNSEYVTIIKGLLDIPTFGVIGYIILLMLTFLRGRVKQQIEFYLPLLTYGAALIGFLYSAVYLTGLEAFVIHAWCYWCVTTAILMTIIFILSIIDLHQAWFKSKLRS
jgi:uncharacterized membrane protein